MPTTATPAMPPRAMLAPVEAVLARAASAARRSSKRNVWFTAVPSACAPTAMSSLEPHSTATVIGSSDLDGRLRHHLQLDP